MKTIQPEPFVVYEIAELPRPVQEKIINQYRENSNYPDSNWWDSTYQVVKDAGLLVGIEIKNIYFSGFSSQGDGACFEGFYSYKSGSKAVVQREYPTDDTLIGIARGLVAVQKPYSYRLEAKVSHSGFYQHEGCTTIEVYDREGTKEVDDQTEKILKETLRDFMRWIYSTLEAEYEYITSDAFIFSEIEEKGLQFRLDGREYTPDE